MNITALLPFILAALIKIHPELVTSDTSDGSGNNDNCNAPPSSPVIPGLPWGERYGPNNGTIICNYSCTNARVDRVNARIDKLRIAGRAGLYCNNFDDKRDSCRTLVSLIQVCGIGGDCDEAIEGLEGVVKECKWEVDGVERVSGIYIAPGRHHWYVLQSE